MLLHIHRPSYNAIYAKFYNILLSRFQIYTSESSKYNDANELNMRLSEYLILQMRHTLYRLVYCVVFSEYSTAAKHKQNIDIPW